ncbi:MAG: 3-hydroxyacyl-CoA dehydrogenase NAD-binding domain-containing protein [Planctomycetota bacterium]|nr:3-hydroxyacyl-CoA dehydrogenase NAD-binding domain-containing protein [Planctomycetota bacterium]
MIDLTGIAMPPDAPPPRSCVRVERPEPGLARIVLDAPHRSLTVFDAPTMRDFDLALEDVEKDASLRGLVITGRDARTFAGGADVDAIAAATDVAFVRRFIELGQAVWDRVAKLSRERAGFTSVCAAGGAIPGGACELALACDRIVLSGAKETRIGLPETQLGILPAWGGATRLPRRIGVPAALDAILTGRLYAAKDAYRRGIVDRVVAPEDLVRIADGVALGRVDCPRRVRGGVGLWLVDRNPLAIAVVAHQARLQVMSRTHGRYPAPLAALEIAARAPLTSYESSFRAEAAAASELAVGPVAKNLIQIFKLTEDAKKLRKASDGSAVRTLERAGVIGAGVMGRGIASLLAERGIATRLSDTIPAALDVALLEHRAEIMEKSKKRRIERNEADAAIDRLTASRTLQGFARAEIVIEAVAERLEVKRAVFAEIARQAGPETILATNTSSLSVAAIAAELPHPERVVGLHFFNPVKKMPLVEIVRGPATSPRVVAEVAALALRLGKTPVVTADCAGFLVNRLLGPYLDESLRLVAAGVAPARLDAALLDFGMPMGPLRLLDEVGFDVAKHAAASLHAAYGARMTPCDVLDALSKDGRLGKKTGKGFYVHGGKRAVLDPSLAALVPASAARARSMTDAELAARPILAMLAEAARALEEHVVTGPRELDLATVFGMGFPPFHGGLLRWADSVGLAAIVAQLERAAEEPDVASRTGGPERFAACATLRELARANRRFHG